MTRKRRKQRGLDANQRRVVARAAQFLLQAFRKQSFRNQQQQLKRGEFSRRLTDLRSQLLNAEPAACPKDHGALAALLDNSGFLRVCTPSGERAVSIPSCYLSIDADKAYRCLLAPPTIHARLTALAKAVPSAAAPATAQRAAPRFAAAAAALAPVVAASPLTFGGFPRGFPTPAPAAAERTAAAPLEFSFGGTARTAPAVRVRAPYWATATTMTTTPGTMTLTTTEMDPRPKQEDPSSLLRAAGPMRLEFGRDRRGGVAWPPVSSADADVADADDAMAAAAAAQEDRRWEGTEDGDEVGDGGGPLLLWGLEDFLQALPARLRDEVRRAAAAAATAAGGGRAVVDVALDAGRPPQLTFSDGSKEGLTARCRASIPEALEALGRYWWWQQQREQDDQEWGDQEPDRERILEKVQENQEEEEEEGQVAGAAMLEEGEAGGGGRRRRWSSQSAAMEVEDAPPAKKARAEEGARGLDPDSDLNVDLDLDDGLDAYLRDADGCDGNSGGGGGSGHAGGDGGESGGDGGGDGGGGGLSLRPLAGSAAVAGGLQQQQVVRQMERQQQRVPGVGGGAVARFGRDNRCCPPGTLHRISALRHPGDGTVLGLTYRMGRHLPGVADLLADALADLAGRGAAAAAAAAGGAAGGSGSGSGRGGGGNSSSGAASELAGSLLLLGRPGSGKTTLLRDIARHLADELRLSVLVVDTSNEIAGGDSVPHPCIGSARRLMVGRREELHARMLEAVQNHGPQVVVVDEIGSKQEAEAARTISARGVMLVATAHGTDLASLMHNPELSSLVGGLQAVTLGDALAGSSNGGAKVRTERRGTPTFRTLVEVLGCGRLRLRPDVAASVDSLLGTDATPAAAAPPPQRYQQHQQHHHQQQWHLPPAVASPGGLRLPPQKQEPGSLVALHGGSGERGLLPPLEQLRWTMRRARVTAGAAAGAGAAAAGGGCRRETPQHFVRVLQPADVCGE